MNNFKIGQKVKIIGDSFAPDTHDFENGTIGIVEELVPATKFEDLPPVVQFLFAINGQDGLDLPERVHLSILNSDGEKDDEHFANVIPTDIVPEVQEGVRVRLLEDDFADGFQSGDEFDVIVDEDDDPMFVDNDGDERYLENFNYEVIS